MLYLLDANVLIDANRDYYPLGRVPEFWEWLVHMGNEGFVKLPLEIYEELKNGNDDLAPGKSVIAMNLVGDLLLQGYNAQYATGSKAFTETLRRNIGTRGAVQFKYFNSYMDADRNAVDVLVCDEAHRIREFSHDRWTPKAKRSNQPQIQELLNAAKVAVFFIDDKQLVRPTEIGSAHDILDTAEKHGCRIFDTSSKPSSAAPAPPASSTG